LHISQKSSIFAPEFAHHTMTFELLAQNIESIQTALQQQAAHAVNLSLTARNWLVGWYIVEYEQNGEDRAQYGEALLKNLAKRIHLRGLGERRLYEFRLMYNAYPQLGEQVLPFVLKFSKKDILRLPTANSNKTDNNPILRSATAISSSTTLEPWQTPADKLFNRFNFLPSYSQVPFDCRTKDRSFSP